MKKFILIFVYLCQIVIVNSQCPTVSCPSALTLTNCQLGQTVSATSNYSANITSRWVGPGNIPIASVGTSTSVVNLNHIGTYTVEFKDNVSNCIVSDSIHVSDITYKPTFNLAVSSYSMLCTSSSIVINIVNSMSPTNPPGAPLSCTLTGTPTSSMIPSAPLGGLTVYSISTCGNWVAHVMDNTSFCTSSYAFIINCSTLAPTPLIVSGNNTVCLGSSVSYTANGNGQNWSTGASGATMNIVPFASANYSVSGLDINGCPSTGTTAVTVNTTCSQVWPGDANSDGIVDNADVFEIGLALNATGPARMPGGNNYVSQYASNWTGMVSTGANLCHADCDGNGIINNTDNQAISANFLLSHAFKPAASTTFNPQVYIVSQAIANAGLWNKADVILGDSSNAINQFYGLAFDLNYDQAMIENDSVYIVYTPSFLNNGGQNIEFKKTIFSAGKFYGTSVRTDGNNVNGSAKIAELHFKVKYGLPENSILNISASHVKKIDRAGITSTLSAGSSSMLIDANTVGIKEKTEMETMTSFFPNPASENVTCLSNSLQTVIYSFYDLNGRKLRDGKFIQSVNINTSDLERGTYFIKFESRSGSFYKKLVLIR